MIFLQLHSFIRIAIAKYIHSLIDLLGSWSIYVSDTVRSTEKPVMNTTKSLPSCISAFSRKTRDTTVVLNWGDFAVHPPRYWQCLEIFFYYSRGRVRGFYRHLTCRGKKCCQISCNAQDSHTQQKIIYPVQNVNTAQVKTV